MVADLTLIKGFRIEEKVNGNLPSGSAGSDFRASYKNQNPNAESINDTSGLDANQSFLRKLRLPTCPERETRRQKLFELELQRLLGVGIDQLRPKGFTPQPDRPKLSLVPIKNPFSNS